MRPSTQTMLVGALYSALMPDGSVPDHPGPVMAKSAASVPVVRLPGSANTLVQPDSIGMR